MVFNNNLLANCINFGIDWIPAILECLINGIGVLLLVGVNPFTRLSVTKVPVLRNRRLSAYLYGLLLAPMTLPCTGPIILSAFLVGAANASILLSLIHI